MAAWFKALTTLILILIKLIYLIPQIEKSSQSSRLGRALMIDGGDGGSSSGMAGVMNVLQDLTSATSGLSFADQSGDGQLDLIQTLAAALTTLNSHHNISALISNSTELELASVSTTTKKPQRISNRRRRRFRTSSRYSTNSSSRMDEEEGDACTDPKDGFNNVAEDIGLLTYLFDCLVQILGLGLLIFAYLPQVYSYFSAYIIAFPSVVLFLLEESVNDSVEDLVDMVGIGDTMFDLLFNIPSNDLINLAAGIVEWLSVTNLFFETLGTFPGFLYFFMDKFFAIDAYEYFHGYGCNFNDSILLWEKPTRSIVLTYLG